MGVKSSGHLKEMEPLFLIAEILERKDLRLDQAQLAVIAELPNGFEAPEQCRVRISLSGLSRKSPGFLPRATERRDITLAYASDFAPEGIAYRGRRGLLDFNEELAVLIQPLVGTGSGGDSLEGLFLEIEFAHDRQALHLLKWRARSAPSRIPFP